MRTIKKFTAILAITGVLFISCDKTTKEKVEDKTEEVEDKMEEISDEITAEYNEMKVELEDGTYVNYKMNKDGDISFDDWSGYNIANSELREIRQSAYVTTTSRLEALKGSIMSLRTSIPAWLKTEEVMEDIANVEKEYNKVMTDTDKSVDNVKQNIEDLDEKFDDLREELNETIEKYKSE